MKSVWLTPDEGRYLSQANQVALMSLESMSHTPLHLMIRFQSGITGGFCAGKVAGPTALGTQLEVWRMACSEGQQPLSLTVLPTIRRRSGIRSGLIFHRGRNSSTARMRNMVFRRSDSRIHTE
jgi:hypothetical protein